MLNVFQSLRDCFYLSSPLPATAVIVGNLGPLKFAHSDKETKIAIGLYETKWF